MYSEGQLRFKKLVEALCVCVYVLRSLECESWCSPSQFEFFSLTLITHSDPICNRVYIMLFLDYFKGNETFLPS